MARVRKAVGALVGATAAGQLILFATSILVARLFTPAEMGVFVAVSAIAGIVGVLLSGRFELAIPLPKREYDALLLARLVLGLVVLLGVLMTAALWLADASAVPSWLSPAVSLYWGVPALCLANAAFLVGNHLAVRAQLYNSLAIRSLAYPAVAGIAQVSLGAAGLGAPGLVLGIAAGQLAAFAVTWLPARRAMNLGSSSLLTKTNSDIKIRWSLPQTWTIAREYWRFPAFLAPAGVLNVLATQLPVLIMTSYFGLAAAGQYGMAMKLAAVPVGLLGASIGYIYSGELSKIARDSIGGARRLLRDTSIRLFAVAVLAFLAVTLSGKLLVVWVMGAEWATAGTFIQVMAVALAAQLVAAPLSQTLSVANAQLAQLSIDAARVMLVAGAAAWSIASGASPTEMVRSMAIGTTLGYVMLWFASHWAAQRIDAAVHASTNEN